jgi:hypothetical protein
MKKIAGPLLFIILSSCVPREAVVFQSIRNVTLETSPSGAPLLKGEATFYNPNSLRMKLKEIKVEISVDGKKSATIDQRPDLEIPASSAFSVPVEARLSLKDLGSLDAILSLLGGKKYEIQYVGYLRIRVHGVPLKIPIKYSDELRLKF